MAKATSEPCFISIEFPLSGKNYPYNFPYIADEEKPEFGWLPLLTVNNEEEANLISDALENQFDEQGITIYWNPKSDFPDHVWLRICVESKRLRKCDRFIYGAWTPYKAAILAFELWATLQKAKEKPKTSGRTKNAQTQRAITHLEAGKTIDQVVELTGLDKENVRQIKSRYVKKQPKT